MEESIQEFATEDALKIARFKTTQAKVRVLLKCFKDDSHVLRSI
jgi:hypothetical protein